MAEFSTPTSRRNLLRFGGIGAGALFLAACTDDRPVGVSGDPAGTTPIPELPDKVATEAALATAQVQIHTLISIETLAAKAYGDHASKVTDPAVASAIGTFAADHDGAARALADLTDDGVVDEPNQYLTETWIAPLERALSSNDSAVEMFRQVESTLTATYIDSLAVLLETEHRQIFMAHGAATARRVALLSADGEIPVGGRYPASDLISGSALLTPEAADGGEGEEGDDAEGDDSADG